MADSNVSKEVIIIAPFISFEVLRHFESPFYFSIVIRSFDAVTIIIGKIG
jgi:hypothetical protein